MSKGIFAKTLYYYNEQYDKIDKYTLDSIVNDDAANYSLILGDKTHRVLSINIRSHSLNQFRYTFEEALSLRKESILIKIGQL